MAAGVCARAGHCSLLPLPQVFQLFLAGFSIIPMTLWTVCQVGLLAKMGTSAAECSLEGLAHPLSRSRIAAFHRGMRSLASLVRPQVRWWCQGAVVVHAQVHPQGCGGGPECRC